jgi:hypothetical protein
MELPKELIIKIFEYDPGERENRQLVLDELIEETSLYCDNDYHCCNNIYPQRDAVECEFRPIGSFSFCSEYCLSAGMWSIRYDYRKDRQ